MHLVVPHDELIQALKREFDYTLSEKIVDRVEVVSSEGFVFDVDSFKLYFREEPNG